MPRLAHERALKQRKSRGRVERLKSGRIRSYVVRHLKKRWSPEQIAGRIKTDLKEHVSHEAVYQFIYAQIRNGSVVRGGEDLRAYLRRRRKRRIPHGARRFQRVAKPLGRCIDERRAHPRQLSQEDRLHENAVYHYHPYAHALEYLWPLQKDVSAGDLLLPDDTDREKPSLVCIFAAQWNKNASKYGDFGYLLGLIEAGHMAQNVLLAAAGLHLAVRPVADLNQDLVGSVLDLDAVQEQAVYGIAIWGGGNPEILDNLGDFSV